MLAYLAIFAGDVAEAQRLLDRAWEGRTLAGDDRLSARFALARLDDRDVILHIDGDGRVAAGDQKHAVAELF